MAATKLDARFSEAKSVAIRGIQEAKKATMSHNYIEDTTVQNPLYQ